MRNTPDSPQKALGKVEWQTVFLIAVTYTCWFALIINAELINPVLWVILTGIVTTLFLSITHEVSHLHPTRSDLINRMLILLPISWVVPYERFRDTHMAHHQTDELTDPFDDPESWYLALNAWQNTPSALKKLLEFNNTLFGRMLIGPVLGFGRFYVEEVLLILRNKHQRHHLIAVWGKHLLLCMALAWIVREISAWQVFASAYVGSSLLMVRSFLEHQASPDKQERTVIIERNCPMAFLFLYNNLHVVHHDKPGVPWYRLPGTYRKNRAHYLALNKGYVYGSYAEVFAKYFFRIKESVHHPLGQ